MGSESLGRAQTALDSFKCGPEPPMLEINPSRDQYEGAFLLNAIGDALGWPTEFLETGGVHSFIKLPVTDYVKWKKRVGGLWWGYYDDIERGQYSDDTQLGLAVARCINEAGNFEPERFAYYELPLWLHYERGGGRSVKAAARSLIRETTEWTNNFYKIGDLDYRFTGANGAAMRNLPIALASARDEKRLIRESARNAIITHGHPRAVGGAILFGLAVRHALSSQGGDADKMLQYLRQSLQYSWNVIMEDQALRQWHGRWEKSIPKRQNSYSSIFQNVIAEIDACLENITKNLKQPAKEYYSKIGAFEPRTKGSGVATVCAAIFQFLKHNDDPNVAIIEAVNLLGSDTDTISSFLGALLGAQHGRKVIYNHFEKDLQDRSYIAKTADRLYTLTWGKKGDVPLQEANVAFSRRQAYINILAWEIGLHEMFWDAIDVDGIVVHPTLGRGRITHKRSAEIRREGYVAKLVSVEFECGQTCMFHSRVKNNDNVTESLARDIDTALGSKIIA